MTIDNFPLSKEKKRSFCHVYLQISLPLLTRANDGKIKREISQHDRDEIFLLFFCLKIKKLGRIKVSDPRANRSRRKRQNERDFTSTTIGRQLAGLSVFAEARSR